MRSLIGAGGVVLCAALVGCASVDLPGAKPVRMFDPGDKFSAERNHLPPGKVPKIGLALSGGGTKAAVFSHGVLHGLKDAAILDHVDVISTTSGGGYAAYWLMSKRMDALDNADAFDGKGYQAIFNDCFPAWFGKRTQAHQVKMSEAAIARVPADMEVCWDDVHFSRDGTDSYRWQAHLLRWPDVFKVGYTPVEPGKRDNIPAYTGLVGLVASVFEGILSPLISPESNVARDSYAVAMYQNGIEKAWGWNPKPRSLPLSDTKDDWTYTNRTTGEEDPWTRKMPHVAPDSMRWERLRSAYRKVRPGDPPLPLWVLNTTQGQKKPLEGNGVPQPEPLNLFEITPFSYGSPRWGYVEEGPDQLLTLARGVRASAAFADAQGIGSQGLAHRVHKASETFRAAKWGVPFVHQPSKERLHLSDGGGADNLALVSAVRRRLTHVIVVDTAQDRRGSMEDLCWSRALLLNEGFKVSFNALQGLDGVCDAVFAGNLPKGVAYNVDAWLNPVIHGTLTWPDTKKVTEVWLIKAAWNEQDAKSAFERVECGFKPDNFNCLLAMFWGTRLNGGSDEDAVKTFPQHGTASQTFDSSPALVLAYRELGRMAASQLQIDASGNLSLRKGTQCNQWPQSQASRRIECFPLKLDR